MSDFVCLYFGSTDECPECGGWVHWERNGGYKGVHGLVFCSEDCAAEYEEVQAR